jgi:hypothetical protein
MLKRKSCSRLLLHTLPQIPNFALWQNENHQLYMFIEDRYEVEVDDSISLFEFVSEGRHGKVNKLVRYSRTNVRNMYNLGFGDKDEETGTINDKSITDNGDSEKVLATVAATIYAFTAENPTIYVYITGSNEARTRLYRIGISKYLEQISEDFVVLGLQNNNWKPFTSSNNYKAFLISRKI